MSLWKCYQGIVNSSNCCQLIYMNTTFAKSKKISKSLGPGERSPDGDEVRQQSQCYSPWGRTGFIPAGKAEHQDDPESLVGHGSREGGCTQGNRSLFQNPPLRSWRSLISSAVTGECPTFLYSKMGEEVLWKEPGLSGFMREEQEVIRGLTGLWLKKSSSWNRRPWKKNTVEEKHWVRAAPSFLS